MAALAVATLPEGARSWSLSELSERVLGRRLPKDEKLRLSNWEAQLEHEQLEYAALDAQASHLIGAELLRLAQARRCAAEGGAGAVGDASGVASYQGGVPLFAVPEDPMRSRLPPAVGLRLASPQVKVVVSVEPATGCDVHVDENIAAAPKRKLPTSF